jgi:hypothetical protein
MNYELSLLEKWAADQGTGVRPDPDSYREEIARIRQAFLGMALSHKKEIFLRRYFRVHYEGLQLLTRELKERKPAKGTKQIITFTDDLQTFLTERFSRYLEPAPGEGLDPDDPDIDSQKVITTFTLAELGVVIRLYIETGVFMVRNRKALTRFMSRNVVIRTKKVPEQFSEEHLYNAIHTPTVPAIDKVQVLLNQMLTELNKLRREQRRK